MPAAQDQRQRSDTTRQVKRQVSGCCWFAYGYGTNSGLRTVAVGDHPHSAEDLRYTAGSVRR